MPYSITTTSGAPVATVQDATINTTSTALTLIGRDYAGYGAFLNENFIHLLENFAANTAPSQKLTGQIWYDTSVNTLKVWNTGINSWKPISSSLAQNNEPTGITSSQGDLWFDTLNNQLHAYNNGWQLIGPEIAATDGTTSGAKVESIQDSSDNFHTIIKLYVRNTVVGIISSDSLFTPKLSINGFTNIKPGFNLAGTSAVADAQYNGDVSNALALNGITSSQFLRSDQPATTAYQLGVGNLVVGSGLTINQLTSNSEIQIQSILPSYDLNVYTNHTGSPTRTLGVSGTTGEITVDNDLSVSGILNVTGATTLSGGATFDGVTTVSDKIVPNSNGVDIGAIATKFANVHATYFNGIFNGNIRSQEIVVGNVNISTIGITVAGSNIATQSYVASYVQAVGRNSRGTRTISTSAPSGGSDGDIWYQV
jgi:hypothetical protein